MAPLSTFKSTSVQRAVSKYVRSFVSFRHHSIVTRQTLDDATATKLAGENPDFGIQSLFETIESGNFPTWNVYIVRIFLVAMSLFHSDLCSKR